MVLHYLYCTCRVHQLIVDLRGNRQGCGLALYVHVRVCIPIKGNGSIRHQV